MPILRSAILTILAATTVEAQTLDLTKATVVAPATLSGPEKKAVAVLVDEVAKRTTIRWPVSTSWPSSGAAIAVGTRLRDEPAAAPGPEGYRLWTSGRDVFIAGNDARGVLFAVGKLLRSLRMDRGSVSLSDGLKIATRPAF